MAKLLRIAGYAVDERLELEQTRIGLLAIEPPHIFVRKQRSLDGAVAHPERERERVQPPVPIDQRADLREEAHPVLPECLQSQCRLPASRREEYQDAALPSRQSETEDARQGARVEVVGSTSQQEVVRRAPRCVRVLALDDGAPGLEHGDSAAEVVDDGLPARSVHNVLFRDVVGEQRTEPVEVRRPPLDRDLDVGRLPVLGLEPREVLTECIDDLQPVTAHSKPEAIDVEARLLHDRSAHLLIVGRVSSVREKAHYYPKVRDDQYAARHVPLSARALRRATRPRWIDLLLALTQADLRARYGRGKVRVLRWLLEPFALAGVYLLFVAVVLNRPGTATGLSLACAVVPFQLLMTTTTNALGSITARRSIILNMTFNRFLIPLATTMTEIVVFAASFSLFVVMMAIYDVAPGSALAWLPLALIVNILLALGIAFPAALFGLWYRELRIFAISFMRTLFFLAPSLVPHSVTSGTAYQLLKLNPLTGLFDTYRAIFLYDTRPPAWALLYPAAVAVLLLVLTLPVYRREQYQFAKVVE